MRKVIYSMLMSLDGFIQDSRGSIEFTIPDEELHKHFNEMDRTVDTYLYGRRIYEIMVAYWPIAEDDPANIDFLKEYSRQ